MLKLLTIESTLNPKGEVVKPDKDGYYLLNAGALNETNSSGIFYEATKRTLDRLRNPNSFVNRKIYHKELYGEYQHPTPTPEMKRLMANPRTAKQGENMFMDRQTSFDKNEVSHHIKSIHLFEDPTKVDPITGKRRILIKVKAKPFGPKGYLFKEALENPHISTALSVRSAALESVKNGRINREIIEFFAWDFVFSPGVKTSTDQRTLGYECDVNMLEDFKQYLKDNNIPGHESDDVKLQTEVCNLLIDTLGTTSRSILKGSW